MGVASIETALAEVQRLVRLPDPPGPLRGGSGRIPNDLATESARTLYLDEESGAALAALAAVLSEDIRFEYMDERGLKDATWRFACLAALHPGDDHVAAFLADHGREPMLRTCFFPVVHLGVGEPLEFQGVRIVPIEDAQLPQQMLAPDPRPTMKSVIAVECRGTDYTKMSVRASEAARHALRLLRAGLREVHFLPDRQLRFRLGEAMWFDDGASGWQAAPDLGWDYTPGEEDLRLAISQPISSLPLDAETDLERRANRALRWFELAQLAVEPLMQLLYLFFALEAILGTDKGGPKARPLALRRAILARRTTEHFAHPSRVYGLYSQVRNAAVHGGEPPTVPQDELSAFSWDVRLALNEYLAFARARDLRDREAVLSALDADPDGPRIAQEFLPRRK